MKVVCKVRFLLVLTLLWISPAILLAQRPITDSLRRVLDTSISGTKRVDVMLQLAFETYDFADSVAFELSNQGLQEAAALNYLNGIKYAHTLIGLGYLNQGNFRPAISSFKISDKIETNITTRSIAGYNLTLLGNIYRALGNYDSAQFNYERAIAVMGGENSGEKRLATTLKNMAQLELLRWRNDDAILLLQKAEAMANKMNNMYLLMEIWNLYGKVFENKLDFEKTKIYFNKMCAFAEKEEDNYHLIMCDLNNAEFSFRLGDFSTSLEHCFSAIKKSDIYYYPIQRADIYLKIGEIYVEISQYDLALKYFLQVLKITEKIGLAGTTSDAYSAMAWIYKDQLNFDKALDYINQSQVIREAMGNQHGVSNCHNVRGLIYYQEKKYDQAITEFEKSIQIRTSIQHIEGISSATFNLSLVYEALNQFDKALDFQLQAIRMEEKIGSKQNLGISYNSISSLMIKLGRLNEAEWYLNKAQTLATFTKSKFLQRNNFKMFAILYETKGNYKMAYKSQLRYQALGDSIYSVGSAVKLSEMQALYQLGKKDEQIKLLNHDKQIKDDELQLQQSLIEQQRVIIFSGLATFLLICFIAYKTYYYNRSIRQAHKSISDQKEKIQVQSEEITDAYNTISDINRNLEIKIEERTTALRQAYKELDTFFYRSSHDFRRPLTTFMGLAEVAKITVKDQNALELFIKVKETAKNLDKMLVKLQSISDVGTQELVYKEVLLKELFDNLCDSFSEQLNEYKIKVSYEIELKETFLSYPAMIKIIMENLMENAISFRDKQNPCIKLRVFVRDEFVILEIADNGQGIDPQYQHRIFEMYYRANEHSKGNGLGLFIVKKSVEKLRGSVAFTSEFMKGSIFTIAIPRNQQHSDAI